MGKIKVWGSGINGVLKKNRKKLIGLTFVLMIAGGVYWGLQNRPDEPPLPGEEEMIYSQIAVDRGDVKRTIYVAGHAMAENEEKLMAVSGVRVKNVYVQLEQDVGVGTLLYDLDDTQARLNYQAAQLDYEKKQQEYRENRGERTGNREIRTRYSGVISEMKVSPGADVTPDTAVASVQNRERMTLRQGMNVNDVKMLSVGDSVQVFLPSYIVFMDAVVTEIDEIDTPSASGGIMRFVTLELKNPGGLKAGDNARLQTELGGRTISGMAMAELNYMPAVEIKAGIRGIVDTQHRNKDDLVGAGTLLYTIKPGNDQLDDRAQALELERSRLALAEAREVLEETQVKASVSGRVIELNVRAGEIPESNLPAMVISSIGSLRMRVVVDEYDVARIYEGQQAEVYFNAFGNEAFPGVVTFVAQSGTVESGSVSFRAEIMLSGDGKVLPGMSGDADIFVENKENALRVPREDISILEAGVGVVQVLNGEGFPEPLEVRIGVEGDHYIEILDGLEEGNLIVSSSSGGRNSFDGPIEKSIIT